MSIFELIATMAAAIRNLDGRITYAPLHLRDGGVTFTLAVNSDEAVRELATRFEMPAPTTRVLVEPDGSATTWLGANLHNGSIDISIYGPHTKHAATSATTAQQGA